jgi:acetyl esterase/lipase
MYSDAEPKLMTLAHVALELRRSVQRMPHVPVSSALGRWFVRTALRLQPAARVEGVQIKSRTGDNGSRVRLHIPNKAETGAALLWIHGGGMVVGSAKQDDRFCATTARELGIAVVAAEYRLAPEYPFPTALDDCLAAWSWLQDSAEELHVDRTRIAIGGQSAGGGLAASLVQRIHDAGGVQPAAQWLFCPMLDDRTAAKTELDVIGHKVWDNRQNRVGWRAFLGTEPGASEVPEYAVAARRGDLRGLPATWIGTGDIELFFDENRTYADRLVAAGAECTLDIVAGAPHGFETIARESRLAQDYVARARDWLRRKLAL